MRIGMVTSGHEMLPLMRCLAHYEHDYHIYRDHAHRPYGDRDPLTVGAAIQAGIDYLTAQGCDQLIIPPLREIEYKKNNTDTLPIIPLWHDYLMHCLTYSLVGKIAFVGDRLDSAILDIVQPLLAGYTLTDRQRATRSFCQPWRPRFVEVSIRKHFVPCWSARDMLVRKTMKKDLAPLRDAGIDTIIPTHWSYLHFSPAIAHYLNHKRCRRHRYDVLETICDRYLTPQATDRQGENQPSNPSNKQQTTTYGITIHSRDDPLVLLQHKRRERLVTRGGAVTLHHERV